MKLLAGIIESNEGEIKQIDANIKYPQWAKSNIAYIPAGDRTLYYKISVKENILYYAALKGENINEVLNKLTYYANKFVMEDLITRKVETLSTGQKKKAQLLCVLCTSKKLLLLDEPSSGLDIDSVYELQRLLTELKEERKIIVSSHDFNLISNVTDEYYFVEAGTIAKHHLGTLNQDDFLAIYNEVKGML